VRALRQDPHDPEALELLSAQLAADFVCLDLRDIGCLVAETRPATPATSATPATHGGGAAERGGGGRSTRREHADGVGGGCLEPLPNRCGIATGQQEGSDSDRRELALQQGCNSAATELQGQQEGSDSDSRELALPRTRHVLGALQREVLEVLRPFPDMFLCRVSLR